MEKDKDDIRRRYIYFARFQLQTAERISNKLLLLIAVIGITILISGLVSKVDDRIITFARESAMYLMGVLSTLLGSTMGSFHSGDDDDED
jgi:uncharacterized membrane protein